MNSRTFEDLRKYLFLAGVMLVLFGSSFYNYLLFHSLVEIYSISIAFTLFMISWNSREYNQHSYIILIGTAYLFIGFLDLFHTLSYKGMNIFTDYDYYANQFWVVARIMESATLLIAFSIIGKRKQRIKYEGVFTAYLSITVLSILSILYYKVFPECFIEGSGQTPFKLWAEVFVAAMLVGALVILRRNRHAVGEKIYPFLVWSIYFTLLSEASFMMYIDNYGISNLVGHFFKLFSYYMIYRAAIDLGLKTPYEVIFRELKEKEDLLKGVALIDLETGLFNRQAYERIREKLWVISKKTETRMGIGLLSISNYEEIENSYGYGMLQTVLGEFVETTRNILSEDYFFFRMEKNEFLVLFGEEEGEVRRIVEKIGKRLTERVKDKHNLRTELNYGVSGHDGIPFLSLEDIYDSANEDLSRKKLRNSVMAL